MILIGLAGKKGTGKSTLAKMITVQCKFMAVEMAFADALKDEVCAACGVSRDYMEEHKQNFRLILQGWGTDFKRKLIDDNYWIGKLGHRLLRQSYNPDVVVITDVRFPNEAAFIRELGGYLIRVNRSSLQGDNHSSEVALDDYKFDYTVDNNTTLIDLQHQASLICKHFKIQLRTTTL